MTVLSLPHSAGPSSAIGDAKAERRRLRPARMVLKPFLFFRAANGGELQRVGVDGLTA